MRIPWKLALVSALALTALLAIPAPAAAYHQGSTQTVSLTVSDNGVAIALDNWTGYTFTLGSGDSIVYGIQVVTGSNIDVYFFTSAGLNAYRNDPPQTSQAISSLANRQQFGGTFSGVTGAVTVVLDNVNGTGATPTGDVTVQVGMTRNGGTPPSTDLFAGIIAAGILLCVGIIVVIVVVIFLIVYLITRGNRPAMPPEWPPYMPPPQQPWPPPQQPPQGGMPPEQYPPQNP